MMNRAQVPHEMDEVGNLECMRSSATPPSA